MQKTITSAKIDKCTKVCYILNSTFYRVANLDGLEKLLL